MKKKICFIFTVISMVFSADSIAKKSDSHKEGLEKRSLTKTLPRSRKNAKIERPTVKRPARRIISRKPKITSAKQRLMTKRPIVTRKPLIAKKADTKSVSRQKAHSPVKAPIHRKNQGNSYVNIDGRIIRGQKINITDRANGSYIIVIDGVRRVIHNSVLTSSSVNSSSTVKQRNGRTKKRSFTNSNYTFITRNNKHIPINSSNDSKVQKDWSKWEKDLETKLNVKMNKGRSKSGKNSFVGPNSLKNIKKYSLNTSGPFKFSNLEVTKDTHITGPTSKSERGKFNSLYITGPFEASDVICQKFNASGPVNVTNLKVVNDAKISGSLKATNASCDQLASTGSVNVTNLRVRKETNISGSLNATRSHFHNLTISSNDILLKDTNVMGNIFIRKPWKNMTQTLRLQGNTTIKGTITFESGKGMIEQSSRTKLQGMIKGAKVSKN